jgi:hypothetical protein
MRTGMILLELATLICIKCPKLPRLAGHRQRRELVHALLRDAATEIIQTKPTELLTRHRACVFPGRRYLRPLPPYLLYLQMASNWVWNRAPQK